MIEVIVVIVLIFAIWGTILSYKVKLKEEKSKFVDRNIEWDGPNVSYKRKNYPDLELNDDHRSEVIDKEKMA